VVRRVAGAPLGAAATSGGAVRPALGPYGPGGPRLHVAVSGTLAAPWSCLAGEGLSACILPFGAAFF
jgi:hypothetical protein